MLFRKSALVSHDFLDTACYDYLNHVGMRGAVGRGAKTVAYFYETRTASVKYSMSDIWRVPETGIYGSKIGCITLCEARTKFEQSACLINRINIYYFLRLYRFKMLVHPV